VFIMSEVPLYRHSPRESKTLAAKVWSEHTGSREHARGAPTLPMSSPLAGNASLMQFN